MDRVEVRVADSQAAFHSHGAQDERGRQAEETHGKAKEVAKVSVTQTYQGHVPGIADEHRWAQEAGAQQVCESQASHEDAEDRGPGAMLLLVHSQDEEGQEVSPHTSQEHDDARRWLAIFIHGESGVAGGIGT